MDKQNPRILSVAPIIVYIIGPFRASTTWAVEQNVRRAEELALQVVDAGAMPLCPHTNTRFFHGIGPDAFWLEGTLELLRRSDAAITVDGWERSTGSKGEVGEADRLGLPMFHAIPPLRRWVELGGPSHDARFDRSKPGSILAEAPATLYGAPFIGRRR